MDKAHGQEGGHVAEVWLEWPLCRGSTLYRQRLATEPQAARFARRMARVLDLVLPTHWHSTDYVGRPCLERYDYGIQYGVRPLTQAEHTTFSPLWSPVMPGHRGHESEHADGHPLLRDAEPFEGSLEGYRA